MPSRGTASTKNSSPATYLMSGATHDGWEDSTGGIVPSETGLAHTGTVVNNERGNIIIHGWLRKKKRREHPRVTHHAPSPVPTAAGVEGKAMPPWTFFPPHPFPSCRRVTASAGAR